MPQRKEKLYLCIDTESLDKSISNSRENVERFLSYNIVDIFEFFRTSFSTTHQNLAIINEYTHQKDIEDLRKIEVVANNALNKSSVSNGEKEFLLLMLEHTQMYTENIVFVTNNNIFLNNRISLEHFFRGIKMVTIEEAIGIMDIFAKAHGLYFSSNISKEKMKLWYWYYFRSKIPHYNVPNPPGSLTSNLILEAFATRFLHMLRSVNEIGIEQYFGDSKEIMIPYHFNYFISLMTGIFDNLAIETWDKYRLQFKGDTILSRISLSNDAGKEFLKAVRNSNQYLRNHISNYVDFIKLIYQLREPILHREGLKQIGYFYNFEISNFVLIPYEIKKLIERCGGKRSSNEISGWGVLANPIKFNNSEYFYLQPFLFAKAATLKFIRFSDEYLRLLGFNRFIDTLEPNDRYLAKVNSFQKHCLCL